MKSTCSVCNQPIKTRSCWNLIMDGIEDEMVWSRPIRNDSRLVIHYHDGCQPDGVVEFLKSNKDPDRTEAIGPKIPTSNIWGFFPSRSSL